MEVLKEIATVHAKELPKNRAATIGLRQLAFIYKTLIQSKCLKIYVCYFDNVTISGALGVLSGKPRLLDIIKINLVALPGIAKNPIRWLKETFIFYFLYKNIKHKNIIMFLFVKSENTRKGYASALLDKLISSGISNLYVDTNASNISALEFYYKNGFIKVKQISAQVLLKK
jgi:GNAT superfamily N-acetyltransferase